MKRKSLLLLLLLAIGLPWAANAQKALPYTYGFENNDLDAEGWTAQVTSSSSGIYNAGSSTAYEGEYLFRFNYSEQSAYLVSPLLTGTDAGVDLSFFYKEYSSTYGDEQFYVGYTTDETVTDPSEFTYGTIVTASTVWQEYTASLPARTKRIAIQYVYNDAFYLYLDAFSFEVPAACPTPTNLTVTNLGPFSATLNWTSEASNFNVRYRTAVGYTPVWEDDFENGLDQWTILHGDEATAPSGGYWYLIDPSSGLSFDAHSGTHVASSWSWNNSAYNADNYLVTPQINLQGAVKFYVRTNQGWPDQYEVLLSTTGNTIEDFTVTLQAMATAPANGEWNEVVIPLTGYSGQGYIAIHHQDYDANYLCIDDFGIYEIIPAGSWIDATANTTTLALTGLSDETDYEWQVQAVCGGQDGSSEWSSIATFQTPSNCEAPANLTATDIEAYSATLNWTGIQNSYNIQYRTAYHRNPVYFTNFNTEDAREGWTWTGYTIYGFADPIYGYSGSENYFLQMGWATTDEVYIISPELPEYESGAALEFYYFAYNEVIPPPPTRQMHLHGEILSQPLLGPIPYIQRCLPQVSSTLLSRLLLKTKITASSSITSESSMKILLPVAGLLLPPMLLPLTSLALIPKPSTNGRCRA